MGKPLGFKDFKRETPKKIDANARIANWKEIYLNWPESDIRDQGARCMDCGVPFCHTGCPLGNIIPEFNDLVYKGEWQKALEVLHSTNNFPEFTGRICPAPCEAACVLNINQDPVTIEYIEKSIIETGFENGWVVPQEPKIRTGKKVAVVGSGPAGLAAAHQLNKSGHTVTVYERDDYIGGLLRIGIPEFKLEKSVVQRRVDLMSEEGIKFVTGTNIGIDIKHDELLDSFDAICLTGGSTIPRDLPIPGRDLKGVYFAMEYLSQQNKELSGEYIDSDEKISAEGKKVVIIGGCDTGADCLGTAHRQGAEIIYQYELLSEPPLERSNNNPWPYWPLILRISSAHEEGGTREFSVLTKSFSGENGVLKSLQGVKIEWIQDENGRPIMSEIPGTEFEIEVDLVLLAMGFVHPQQEGIIDQLGIELDGRNNVNTNIQHMTNVDKVFSAGDMHRGQSLVVWAIAEGREAAYHIDKYLMGVTELPQSLPGALPR